MSLEMNTPPEVTGHLLLFRKTNWAEDGLSQEEVRQIMDQVTEWFGRLEASGKVLGAQPLMEQGVVIGGKGGKSVTDGPFAEAKESIGGYVLLSVKSMEEAVAIARSNPMHDYGMITEVRPTASNCPYLHRILGSPAEALAS